MREHYAGNRGREMLRELRECSSGVFKPGWQNSLPGVVRVYAWTLRLTWSGPHRQRSGTLWQFSERRLEAKTPRDCSRGGLAAHQALSHRRGGLDEFPRWPAPRSGFHEGRDRAASRWGACRAGGRSTAGLSAVGRRS